MTSPFCPKCVAPGQGGGVLPMLADVARTEGFRSMSLVSVNGSRRFWERQGFEVRMDERLVQKLSSYGDDALYMERHLV